MYFTQFSRIKRIQSVLLFGSFCALTLISGCSDGKPAESQGQSILARQIQMESGGKIRLVTFKKTNGVGGSSPLYRMEYQATIEFTESGNWERGTDDPYADVSFRFSTQNIGGGALNNFINSVNASRVVIRGQKQNILGSILFEKTENGWREHNAR